MIAIKKTTLISLPHEAAS